MRPPLRYGLALFVGLVAGAASWLLTGGEVEPTRTWFAAGLNVVVWFGFVALYVPVYDQFDGAPANSEASDPIDAMKWGGIAGGAASVGVSGVPLLLIESVPGRFVAAVGLFVFGLVLLGMAVGMGTVATNLPDDWSGDGVDANGASAADD